MIRQYDIQSDDYQLHVSRVAVALNQDPVYTPFLEELEEAVRTSLVLKKLLIPSDSQPDGLPGRLQAAVTYANAALILGTQNLTTLIGLDTNGQLAELMVSHYARPVLVDSLRGRDDTFDPCVWASVNFLAQTATTFFPLDAIVGCNRLLDQLSLRLFEHQRIMEVVRQRRISSEVLADINQSLRHRH